MRILCTVCARGGSVGVKNKNIRMLRKKPLIAHSLSQARSSQVFDKIVVSSDSLKILDIGMKWGADYAINRPHELASSTASKIPVIQHAVLESEKFFQTSYDLIFDLDVTSPLRSVEDILACYELFINNPQADNLVTAMPSRRSPYFNMLEKTPDGYTKLVKESESSIVRRQDAPPCYDMNASIYIWKRDTLFSSNKTIAAKTLLYVMPEERSIDIDSMLDWKLVNLLAKSQIEI